MIVATVVQPFSHYHYRSETLCLLSSFFVGFASGSRNESTLAK
jgi:hypothetical protein